MLCPQTNDPNLAQLRAALKSRLQQAFFAAHQRDHVPLSRQHMLLERIAHHGKNIKVIRRRGRHESVPLRDKVWMEGLEGSGSSRANSRRYSGASQYDRESRKAYGRTAQIAMIFLCAQERVLEEWWWGCWIQCGSSVGAGVGARSRRPRGQRLQNRKSELF